MKDIDFDELDRAVSSLIANNSSTNIANDALVSNPTFSKTPIDSHFNATKVPPRQSSSTVLSPVKPIDPTVASVVNIPQGVVRSEVTQPANQAVFSMLSSDYVEVNSPTSSQVPAPNPVVTSSAVLPRPTNATFSSTVRLVPKIIKPAVADTVAPVPVVTTSIAVNSVPVTKPLPTIPIPAKPIQSISPLVSRRSSGRFMDVVPSSTDMRTVLSAPDRASRLGSDLDIHKPTSQIVVSQDVEVTPNPQQQVSSPNVPEPVKSDWSDLVEFDDVSDLKKTSVSDYVEPVVEVDEDDDIDRINADIDKTLGQTPEVQESPFLSGAKVEKRPLNAFMAESLNATPSGVVEEVNATPAKVEVVAEKTISMGQDSNPGQVDMDAPLPAELQGDLLTIESGNVPSEAEVVLASASLSSLAIAPAQTTTPAPTPIQAQTQVASPVIAPQPRVISAPTTVPSIISSKTSPVADGPTSISQQYQEKPSTGDQSTGAIFDTASYHKTVVKPVKKNTNLFWVVWILLLLVIGVGVGAAIYFFVVPLL